MSSATIRTILLAALLSQPDHAFDYSLPAGRWVLLPLKASATATTLYIDGLPVQTLPVSVVLPRR